MDASGWDDRYSASDLVWSAGPNQFVEQALADLTPGRALDLAAGEGRNAIWLARRGWQVTAVDFSQAGLDKGRRLAGETAVDWICADATSWTSPDSFDLVVIAYLQLPAPQRAAAVRNGFASLTPGGTFFLVVHDSSNLAEGTGGPQDPTVLCTADDVLADLTGHDLEVVRAGRVGREAMADDGHGGEERRTAYDALVHARRR